MLFHRALTISVCLFAGVPAATAQQPLTLADATARALDRNHSIRIERESIAAADARVLDARGAYDLQLRFEVGARHHKDSITSFFSGAPDGSAGPSQHHVQSGLSLSQAFRSGAVATVSTSVAREASNSAFTMFDPAYTTSLGVDLRQPLLRNRAIDPARAALRVTALDRDRSGAALTRQVLQTVSDVETAYWQLVAARRDLDVRRGNLALAERQRVDTQARIQGGTVPASDLAQPTAEIERRRGDLFAAQEAVARAERSLKQLILGDSRDPTWDIELAPADAPDALPRRVDVAAAIDEARRNRPELTEIAADISQQNIEVTLAKDAMKPRLDLVLGYTMRGLSGEQRATAVPIANVPAALPSSLDGGLLSSWRSLGDQTFPDASVSLSFEIPIGQRSARGQLGAAEAGRRRSSAAMAQARDAITVEVRNAATAIETAAGRIQAARAGLAAAETQLRAEQDRFDAGLSTNFFVLTRQNDLALAQLAEIAAQADYQKALTEFGRATGTLLRDRGIQVN